MPNWCIGTVKVKGKEKNIKDFCKLFLFSSGDGHEPKTKGRYFPRSFIHEDWKDFEKDNLKNIKDEINFNVNFAWSCYSCLIEGYPQENEKECITLKDACKKYNVFVSIHSEEPGMSFEEFIECDSEDLLYDNKDMMERQCVKCKSIQSITSQQDIKEVDCWECGSIGGWRLISELKYMGRGKNEKKTQKTIPF